MAHSSVAIDSTKFFEIRLKTLCKVILIATISTFVKTLIKAIQLGLKTIYVSGLLSYFNEEEVNLNQDLFLIYNSFDNYY